MQEVSSHRRRFLNRGAALAASALSAPFLLPRVALGGRGGRESGRDVLVNVFLRGGAFF